MISVINTSPNSIDSVVERNSKLCEKIDIFRRAIQNIRESTKIHQSKIRLMNRKMTLNNHNAMQIKTKKRELEDELRSTKLTFGQKKNELLAMQKQLIDVKEEKANLQKEVRREKEMARQHIKPRDFFTTTTKEYVSVNFGSLPAKMIAQLREKLAEKQKVLTAIDPVVSRLNNKFLIFNQTKRRQRKELNKLRNQMSRDVINLQKALAWIEEMQ